MSRGRQTEAASEYIGAESNLTIGERHRETDIIDKVVSLEGAELEAFMSEPVKIVIAESAEENDPPMVQVGVNGVTQFIVRGMEQTVKRKYVERLARAKRTDYDQTIDDRLGEAMNRLRRRNALRFPFTVLEDRNPRGQAWLRGVLAEA